MAANFVNDANLCICHLDCTVKIIYFGTSDRNASLRHMGNYILNRFVPMVSGWCTIWMEQASWINSQLTLLFLDLEITINVKLFWTFGGKLHINNACRSLFFPHSWPTSFCQQNIRLDCLLSWKKQSNLFVVQLLASALYLLWIHIS